MKFTKIAASFTAAAVVAGLSTTAGAATISDDYNETPLINPELPIVHTFHGSDHIKANILNPHPVCNPWEDYRTVLYKAKDNFTPAGTISATNQTTNDIPLSQSLSMSQSISLNVKGDRSMSTSMNIGGGYSKDGGSVSNGITMSLSQSLGASASYSLSWNQGQSIGPYTIKPGETGEATYGFRTITMDGTQQYCKPNGTWSTPTLWSALAPIKKEVKVKTYSTLAGAHDAVANNKVDHVINENLKNETEPTVEENTSVDAGDVVGDDSAVEEDKVVKPVETEEIVSGAEAENKIAEEDAKASEAKDPSEAVNSDYELTPRLTTAKATGFSGAVALRLKNTGTKRYEPDFPYTTYRIEVKTTAKPGDYLYGVDRFMTAGWFNGAYTRDLGFDRDKSVRTFEVTLSNPIEPGEEVLVSNIHFGDGLIRGHRMTNTITVTQTGGHKGDANVNAKEFNSADITTDDFGNKAKGVF
ncbi:MULTISPECIES: hypothetical protein [Corynebacterium]|uniref:Secreted protein n=1 Tax=Corynebacterium glucuronolyticum TaxID=39791 RepID=A0A7T4JW66_9CORY|nr:MULTISPECIES: hypothetical protein [Corynebacterium]MCT1562881.1 hypothetical protein [Corynebacterium glucuronolyticum]OFO42419.1 hypothetical protein HMPREF3044_05755 [Corynebacterium sp. HMSC073D01]QQB47567.1 hypothetical protein I6I10_06765 [Corynebacterium glucuronolyticum]WKD64076.1 hypothetical protein CGLUCO_09155 [Corynebacterium glucuronolyticum DSM 44120]SMB85019.1 hypothetical protein SAMN05660745_01357 [Corynebacterium glucuronolyticum]